MKNIIVRIELVDEEGRPLRSVSYGTNDYPDSITEWVECSLEDLWEYRFDEE